MTEERKPYEMPRPPIGTPVVWYPRGIKGENPEIAFVIRVGFGSAVIRLATGTSRETVRHIDDPRLQMSEYQRENGAWDFTDETRKIMQLEARVKELESLLSPTKPVAEPAPVEEEAPKKVHWKTAAKLAKEQEAVAS